MEKPMNWKTQKTNVQTTWRKYGWVPPTELKPPPQEVEMKFEDYQKSIAKDENHMKQFIEQYKEENATIEYCPYCITLRMDAISCCDENHWIEFKDFDDATQNEIISDEWDKAFGARA
jgi:hypothetical protein